MWLLVEVKNNKRPKYSVLRFNLLHFLNFITVIIIASWHIWLKSKQIQIAYISALAH